MNQEDQTPYVIENSPKGSWLRSKQAKIVAAAVGGVLVLGATFAGGVAVAGSFGPTFGHSQVGFGGDKDFGGGHDGDRGGFKPGGDDNGGFNPPAQNN